MPITAAYGAWKSPVTSEILAQGGLCFMDLQVDQVRDKQDTIYWAELRYAEEGRYVVCSASGPNFDTVVQWTPAGYSARTSLHEYGGGSFKVHNGVVYFSNSVSTKGEPANRLYVQTSPDSEPRAISPNTDLLRFADFCVVGTDHVLVYAVCEEHYADDKEPSNYVCVIDPATGELHKVVSGADFYAAPRVNSDGSQIAYVEWYHPCMPWDTTQIRSARLINGGLAIDTDSIRTYAGFDVTHSALHPIWLSNNTLSYVHDATGFWNVYSRNTDGSEVRSQRYYKKAQIEAALKSEHAVFTRNEDCGRPPWVLCQSPFAAHAVKRGESSQLVLSFGDAELYSVDYKADEHEKIHFGEARRKIETGVYTHLPYIAYSHTLRTVFAIGGSGSRYSSVLRIPMEQSESGVQVIRVSSQFLLDPASISERQLVKYDTSEDQVSYANYYAPRNKDYVAPADSKPPLLILAHGGPHDSCDPTLRLQIQYYTTRGFAVMDVNYRGSALLGRKYRDALKNQWGVYDVEDCTRAALYAVEHSLADRSRLCISGGSAGGFLVLACLAFRKVFSAGSALYGVADMEMLERDTHKFESHYLEGLTGVYPPCAHLFRSRSPIYAVDNISCPLILFQGTADKIVPPEQSISIYEAVKRKGLPTSLLMFEGEVHGFCKSENVRTQIDGEFYFFTKMFGIDAPDLEHVKPKIQIDNI